MFAQLYILVAVIILLFPIVRHAYLLRFKFMKILKQNHTTEWEKMMKDTRWLTPNWSSLYRTKSFHDFVWYSNEDYGDHDLKKLRNRLKKIVLEITLAFVMVVVVTVLLINFKILR